MPRKILKQFVGNVELRPEGTSIGIDGHKQPINARGAAAGGDWAATVPSEEPLLPASGADFVIAGLAASGFPTSVAPESLPSRDGSSAQHCIAAPKANVIDSRSMAGAARLGTRSRDGRSATVIGFRRSTIDQANAHNAAENAAAVSGTKVAEASRVIAAKTTPATTSHSRRPVPCCQMPSDRTNKKTAQRRTAWPPDVRSHRPVDAVANRQRQRLQPRVAHNPAGLAASRCQGMAGPALSFGQMASGR